MLCEDDENNSEPEIVTHDDVRPEESPEREPDVTSRQSAALEAKADSLADSLADDLSKAALAGKGDGEKVAKRNDVAGAVGAVVAAGAAVGVVAAAGAAVATVSSPKSNRAPSPNVAADDDDDRPQPPDDDSVPDEDSLVIFLIWRRKASLRKHFCTSHTGGVACKREQARAARSVPHAHVSVSRARRQLAVRQHSQSSHQAGVACKH